MMNAESSASRPKTFVSVELSGDGLERLMKENEEPVKSFKSALIAIAFQSILGSLSQRNSVI